MPWHVKVVSLKIDIYFLLLWSKSRNRFLGLRKCINNIWLCSFLLFHFLDIYGFQIREIFLPKKARICLCSSLTKNKQNTDWYFFSNKRKSFESESLLLGLFVLQKRILRKNDLYSWWFRFSYEIKCKKNHSWKSHYYVSSNVTSKYIYEFSVVLILDSDMGNNNNHMLLVLLGGLQQSPYFCVSWYIFHVHQS